MESNIFLHQSDMHILFFIIVVSFIPDYKSIQITRGDLNTNVYISIYICCFYSVLILRIGKNVGYSYLMLQEYQNTFALRKNMLIL